MDLLPCSYKKDGETRAGPSSSSPPTDKTKSSVRNVVTYLCFLEC